MRDINRIKPLLKEFQELWESSPDLRFGQLVYILANKIKLANKIDISDIFFSEEADWLKAIKESKIKL